MRDIVRGIAVVHEQLGAFWFAVVLVSGTATLCLYVSP